MTLPNAPTVTLNEVWTLFLEISFDSKVAQSYFLFSHPVTNDYVIFDSGLYDNHVFCQFIIKCKSHSLKKVVHLRSTGTGNTDTEQEFCQRIVVCH